MSQRRDDRSHTTTPLGGQVRPASFPLVDHRRGFAAMVRLCPACKHENSSQALFCSDCGEDIRHLAPTPSTSERPGIEIMRARMRRDKRRERRILEQEGAGGGGWLLLSPFLLLPAIALPDDTPIRYGLWLVGMVCALVGLWQIRQNSTAIRGWGIVLGVVTAITFVHFGVQAYSNRDSGHHGVAIASPSPVAVAQVNAATAVPGSAKVTTDVLAFRGDSAHTGQQPGPPPAGNPVLAWRFDTGGEVYSTPVIADGTLFVASKNGTLFALDAATGTPRWQFPLTTYAVRSSPAVADGIVYIGAGFDLYAIDTASGKLRWKQEMRYAGQATPAIADGVVVAASQEGWLYAFDLRSGAPRWRILTDGVVFGSPAIAGGQVYLGTDKGTTYSLALDTGSIRWEKTLPAGVVASPTVANGKVFFALESGQTIAVDAARGTTFWTAELGGLQPLAALPATLIVASSDGGIQAIDQATGTSSWIYPTGKQAVAAPAVAGPNVFVGAGDTLLNLNGQTGKLEGYYLANGGIETTPVVVDGYIFFGSEDGFVYALKAQA